MSAIILHKRPDVEPRQRPWDPCFTCPLAECDDRDPRCGYRLALAVYQYCLRHDKPVTDEMREQYTLAKAAIYGGNMLYAPKPREKRPFRFKWAEKGRTVQEATIDAYDLNGAMATFRYRHKVGKRDCAFFEVKECEVYDA